MSNGKTYVHVQPNEEKKKNHRDEHYISVGQLKLVYKEKNQVAQEIARGKRLCRDVDVVTTIIRIEKQIRKPDSERQRRQKRAVKSEAAAKQTKTMN